MLSLSSEIFPRRCSARPTIPRPKHKILPSSSEVLPLYCSARPNTKAKLYVYRIFFQRRCESLDFQNSTNVWLKNNINTRNERNSNTVGYRCRRPSLHSRIQDGKYQFFSFSNFRNAYIINNNFKLKITTGNNCRKKSAIMFRQWTFIRDGR